MSNTGAGGEEVVRARGGRARARWAVFTCLFLLALVLRIGFLYQASDTPLFSGSEIEPDATYYDKVARRVAAGELLRSDAFYMAPLYPYALGAVYAVIGETTRSEETFENKMTARYCQALLGALSVVLIASIAWEFGGALPGVIAGLLAATYGFFVFQDGLLMATGVILFTHLAALRALMTAWRRRSGPAWLGAGLLLGVVVLAHGTGLMILALATGWVLVAMRAVSFKRRVALAGLMVAGVAPFIALTAAHNYVASGDFLLLTSNAGRNFFIGNNPTATGTFKFYDFGMRGSSLGHYVMGQERRAIDPDPSEISSRAMRAALGFAAQNPGDAAALLAHKAGLFLHRVELSTRYNYYFHQRYSRVLRWCALGFGMIAPVGLLGLGLAAACSRRHGLLILFFLSQLVAFTLTFVLGRYRVVAVACLMVGVGLAVAWAVDKLRERRWRPLVAAGLVLIPLIWLVNRPIEGFDEHRGWGVPHFHAGKVYFERGQLEQAKQELEKALRASYEPLEKVQLWKAEVHVALAAVAQQRGEPEATLGHLRNALAAAEREVPGPRRAFMVEQLRRKVAAAERRLAREEPSRAEDDL
jgi:tetratricopeptide (TPR) repeat protein